jgi:hypothetical protein
MKFFSVKMYDLLAWKDVLKWVYSVDNCCSLSVSP